MVASPAEIELKYALENHRQLDALLRAVSAPEAAFTQYNNYLDDAQKTLVGAQIMVRAREISFPVGAALGLGKPPVTITAKRRVSARTGLFISEEREQVMRLDDWRDFELGRGEMDLKGAALAWAANVVPYGPRRILGQTINVRYQVRSGPFILEIDRTKFPDDSIDLELECETVAPDIAREHIEQLLKSLKIAFVPQTKGKFERFLERAQA